MVQINEIAGVAQGETVGLQQLPRVGQRVPGLNGSLLRVVKEPVPVNLQIVDIRDVELPRSALGAKHEPGALLAAGGGHRLLQLEGEGIVTHGLDHEVRRLYLVALNCVLGHVGDEDEDALAPQVPEPLGSLHAAQVRHLDVHQHDVPVRPRGEEVEAVPEGSDLELFAILALEPLEVARQLLRHGGLVIHNGYFQHVFSSRPFTFVVFEKNYIIKICPVVVQKSEQWRGEGGANLRFQPTWTQISIDKNRLRVLSF
ncbi:hypothetical protein KL86CLO1_10447 [uncultured Eubacteriales bacterium]|uniref:Uncharacterized protein n=1 Tax=uncultured Eubacteriales bacterium TaxID=172733 RepID=A0A212J3B7_9FIRM|nr:hypothetical protein KL86CLO1_10447 [uncultured Eubacteriales bacterium]